MTERKLGDDKINIDHISTKTAAHNFLASLEPGKTYFLNGDWGSGKTEFIHEAQEKSELNFKYLDLWHVVDERTVVTRGFCKLHPIVYYLLRIAFVMCVVFSILMTDISQISLPFLDNGIIRNLFGVFVLFVSVWTFFRVKSDYVYVSILKRFPGNKNRVIIIDDFDRASSKTQEQAYLFFNIIQGKYTIIFLGDFNKISLSNGTYLRKIIDMKFCLPYALQPINIWDKYLNIVATHLGLTPNETSVLKTIAVDEQRNLRDQKQFNDLLNQEFYDRKKLSHVESYDQLLIIYIYLFHEDLYESLLRGKPVNFPKTHKVSQDSNMSDDLDSLLSGDVEDDEQELECNVSNSLYTELKQIRSHFSTSYPLSFGIDAEPYFISESPSNRTTEELHAIINSPQDLTNEFKAISRTDFYDYVSQNMQSFKDKDFKKLLDTAINLYRKNVSTKLVNLLLNSYNQEINKKRTSDNSIELSYQKIEDESAKYNFLSWKKKLAPYGYDLSEVASLIVDNQFISYNLLAKKIFFNDLEEISKGISKRPDTLLLLYLSGHDLWEKYDKWPNELWALINSLPDALFIRFLLKQQLLEEELNKNVLFSTKKSYILVISYEDIDPPHNQHSNEEALNRIDKRINTLKSAGYVFTRKPSTSRAYKS